MHPDEGTIQAYVEGQLPPAEQEVVGAHVASCAQCGHMVAEARGIIAAASRIVTALDDVPANVIPARRVRRLPPWVAAAAALLLAVGVTSVMWRPGDEIPTSRATPRAAEVPVAGSSAAHDVAVGSSVTPGATTEGDASAAPTSQRTTGRAPARVGETEPAGAQVTRDTRRTLAGSRERTAAPTRAREPSTGQGVFVSDEAAGITPPPAPASPPAPPGAPVSERVAELSGAGSAAASSMAGGTDTARAQAARDAAGAARTRQVLRLESVVVTSAPSAFVQESPVPLRVVRYDAGRAIVELREYNAALPPPVEPRPAGTGEYRWTDSAETRIYVLSGPYSTAELERLALRLGELRVVP